MTIDPSIAEQLFQHLDDEATLAELHSVLSAQAEQLGWNHTAIDVPQRDRAPIRDVVPEYPLETEGQRLLASVLSNALMQQLRVQSALGLSANQIGLSIFRAFAIASSPSFVMINPKIVWFSEKEVMMQEACVSFRGCSLNIKRPASIKVRYQLPSGEFMTETFTGLTARVVQHEMDHLNGVTMFDRASFLQREKAEKQLKKMDRINKAFSRIGVKK